MNLLLNGKYSDSLTPVPVLLLLGDGAPDEPAVPILYSLTPVLLLLGDGSPDEPAVEREILLPRRQLPALEEEEEDQVHRLLQDRDHQGDEGRRPHVIN